MTEILYNCMLLHFSSQLHVHRCHSLPLDMMRHLYLEREKCYKSAPSIVQSPPFLQLLNIYQTMTVSVTNMIMYFRLLEQWLRCEIRGNSVIRSYELPFLPELMRWKRNTAELGPCWESSNELFKLTLEKSQILMGAGSMVLYKMLRRLWPRQ